MTMHAYGFVLPIGFSWAPVLEGNHQLLCRCNAGWTWKDSDLRHVPAQALLDLARKHEEAVHAPRGMKVGLRTAPASGNCLGGELELPSRWIDAIPVEFNRGRGEQRTAVPAHYDGVQLMSGKWVDTPGGVLPAHERAKLTEGELERLRELGVQVPQRGLPWDDPNSDPLGDVRQAYVDAGTQFEREHRERVAELQPMSPEETGDKLRGLKHWIRSLVDWALGRNC